MNAESDLRAVLRWGDDVPVDTDAVLAGVRRRPRRNRRAAALVAVAAATATMFVVLSTTGGEGGLGPRAFAIARLPGDVVSIHVVDTDASAEQMTRQLQEHGLDITIEAVPTNRQLVGTWLWVSQSEDVPRSVGRSVEEQLAGYTATIELPSSFPGEITLGVGRAAKEGEELQVGGIRNALAPGGLLFCERLRDLPPAEVHRRLTAKGYVVGWAAPRGRRFVPSPPPGVVTEAFVVDFEAMGRGEIGDDEDTRDVRVVVREPSDPLYEQQRWMGFSPSQRAAGEIDYSSCPGPG